MVSYNYIHDFFRNPNIAIHPHTWRIHSHIKYMTTPTRITSTYVENTLTLPILLPVIKDHLHIRGEYPHKLERIVIILGSPPHTWRIPDPCHCIFVWFRITSTYVENTKGLTWFMYQVWDHLHIRGEYMEVCAKAGYKVGSPPHTWRIPTQIQVPNFFTRITSTYVENTIKETF